MKIYLLLALMLITQNSWSSETLAQKLKQVDPYSLESLEKFFPESIQRTLIVDSGHEQQIPKRSGPTLKENKTINYEALVPHLIAALKNQQAQIEALKAQQKSVSLD